MPTTEYTAPSGKAPAKAPSARRLAAEFLGTWFGSHGDLTPTREAFLSRYELSPDESRLFHELVFGVARLGRRLDWLLKTKVQRLETNTPVLINLLRVGLLQILDMDRIPTFAAVNEAVEHARRAVGPGAAKFTNAVLRGLARQHESGSLPKPDLTQAAGLAAWWNVPEWLAARWLARYGAEQAGLMLEALSRRPGLECWRRPGEAPDLGEAGWPELHPHPLVPGAFESAWRRSEVLHSAAVQQGWLHVQGAASQAVAQIAAPQAGERILDLCAAPGGKTALLWHLAGGDHGGTELVACEVHPERFAVLQRTLRLLGAGGVRAFRADGTRCEAGVLGAAEPHSFDLVLVDAPCSSLGVMRSTPEVRWTRRESDLASFAERQLALLRAGCGWLKPGGRLVYAVCVLEPEETTQLVARLLAEQPGLRAEPLDERWQGLLRQSPDGPGAFVDVAGTGLEGFYVAVLRAPTEPGAA